MLGLFTEWVGWVLWEDYWVREFYRPLGASGEGENPPRHTRQPPGNVVRGGESWERGGREGEERCQAGRQLDPGFTCRLLPVTGSNHGPGVFTRRPGVCTQTSPLTKARRLQRVSESSECPSQNSNGAMRKLYTLGAIDHLESLDFVFLALCCCDAVLAVHVYVFWDTLTRRIYIPFYRSW